MKRIVYLVGFSVLAWGCEHTGPETSWAAQAAADSVELRRVELPLQAGPSIAASPDGQSFMGFLARNGGLAVASLDGSVRVLDYGPGNAPGDAPKYSRDGQWVAYNWYPAGSDYRSLQIRVSPTAGGEPRVLFSGGYALPSDWSPDGRQLAAIEFREDGMVQILLIPTAGGEPLIVRALDWRMPNAVNFSPDGRFLVFDAPTSDGTLERDIVVYDLDTGRDRRILDHPSNDLLLGWSPTGALLFSSERSGMPAAWSVQMEDGRPVGDPMLLKPDFFRARPIGFTRSGDFYFAVQSGGPVAQVLTLDAHGRPEGPPRLLTEPGEVSLAPRISVSRDGRLISFVASENVGARRDNDKGGVLLRIRPVEGGEGRDIHLPGTIRDAALHEWLPDATRIVFKGNEEGRYGIFQLDLRTGEVERLMAGGGLDGMAGTFRFDLTPDGKSLVYIEDVGGNEEGRRTRMVVRDLSSGGDRVLDEAPGWSGPNTPPAVSPDGTRIAFYRLAGGSPSRPGEFDLMIMPFNGGEPRKVATTGGGNIAWSTDGRSLFVGGPEIRRYPIEGGEAEGLGVEGRILHVEDRRLLTALPNPSQRYEVWVMRFGRDR